MRNTGLLDYHAPLGYNELMCCAPDAGIDDMILIFEAIRRRVLTAVCCELIVLMF